jgi:hypothetical protein
MQLTICCFSEMTFSFFQKVRIAATEYQRHVATNKANEIINLRHHQIEPAM